MSIPNNEAFETFLSQCSVHPERPAGPSVAVTDRYRSTRSGAPGKEYFLAYPSDGVPLDAVARQIGDSLVKGGVPRDDRVAVTTMALIVETRRSGVSAVEHANRCLGTKQQTRLMQSIVLPSNPRHDYDVSLGTYRITPFRSEKILYWAQRCGSAFPRDLRDLNGWAELGRGPLDLVLPDWSRAFLEGPILQRWGTTVAYDDFMDCYFNAIAWAVARTAKEQIKNDVLVLESAAMFHVDMDRLLSTMLLKIVSLFVWNQETRTKTWATYSDQTMLHANLPDQRGLADCRAWLNTKLGFSQLNDASLFDKTTRTYCQFLQRAHGHRLDARPDEAFIHFVIALDLLLGADGRSSDSVAVRASTLVHRQANRTLEEMTKRLKRLYGLRSKYVHDGRGVSAADLREVEAICSEVLWTLLYVSGKGDIQDIDQWLRKVDFLAAGIGAKQSFPQAEFDSVGIPDEGSERTPPLRVLDTNEVPRLSVT